MDQAISRFAPRVEPPYYVAIFSSAYSGDPEISQRATSVVFRLAARHPGFIGAETARDASGFGITSFYWTDRSSLDEWNEEVFERVREEFDQSERFTIFDRRVMRIARVEAYEQMERKPENSDQPPRIAFT